MSVIVITGASDGIGAAAARRLNADGHEVVIVGRNPDKTKQLADELSVRYHVADYSRLDDVSRLAQELLAEHPSIDILANNAGALSGTYTTTVDGFEWALQVNHLAPYLLTRLLLGNVLAARGAVLWTSSASIRMVRSVSPDVLDSASPVTKYRPLYSYAEAKLVSLLAMADLHRRFAVRGLRTAAFHPGVVGSNFSADTDGFIGWFYRSGLGRLVMTSPQKGAAELVRMASSQDWEPGLYYEGGRPARRPPAVLADGEMARAVWERTEDLLAAHVE